jgi:molecular chaperone GrpE
MDQPEINDQKQPQEEDAESMTMGAINAAEVQRLQKELNETRDKYLRVLAEMENARKRAIKERQESCQQAAADVIIEFLKPLDNMENALNYTDKMSPDVQNWATGFQMILTQFKDVLAANGVVAVPSKGQHFDPHMHEAIEILKTDEYPHGTVVEEFTKGYQMGTRTIRPARVKVAQELDANDLSIDSESTSYMNEE